MRRRNAFTDWTDWLHALIGFTASMLLKLSWIPSLIITIAYVAYQSLESEGRQASYEDLVEFLVGFAIGLILSRSL